MTDEKRKRGRPRKGEVVEPRPKPEKKPRTKKKVRSVEELLEKPYGSTSPHLKFDGGDYDEAMAEKMEAIREQERLEKEERERNRKAMPTLLRHAGPTARLARQEQVADLYMQGKTQGQIAEVLGITTATVHKDLVLIRDMWVEKATMKLEVRKAEELAKLDALEREAYSAWMKSKEDNVTTVEKYEDLRDTSEDFNEDPEFLARKKKGGRPIYVAYKRTKEVRIKTSAGDPRYLEQINRCVELRLKLLGMLKNDITTNNNIQINWSDMFKPVEVIEDALEAKLRDLPKVIGYDEVEPTSVEVIQSTNPPTPKPDNTTHE